MTYLSPGILDGADRIDALLDEDRDAEILDAERADLYVDHGEPAYLPTAAAREYLAARDEDDTAPARGMVLGLLLGAAMWAAAFLIAIDLGAFS